MTMPPADGEPRHRRLLVAAIGLIVLLNLGVIGTAIGWTVYAHTYQPLKASSTSWSATPRTLVTLTDGEERTEMWLRGPYRTKGVADLAARNTGSHAVTILGIKTYKGGGLAPHTLALRWGPLRAPHQSSVVGRPADSRPLPVTIRPGNAVILEFTITKQNRCTSGFSWYLTDLPVAWTAFGLHHVWDIPLGDEHSDAAMLPIALCAPKTARKSIER